MSTKKVALYPGTFDPCTTGHMDIIKRASKLYDTLIIAVSDHPKKQTKFGLETRIKAAKAAVAALGNVEVVGFDGLLVDCAVEHNATVVIRGLRVIADFEYEFQMTQFMKDQNPNVETVYLMASGKNLHVSSSAVRELMRMKADFSAYVPKEVLEIIR